MMTAPLRAATITVVAARVALGVLLLHEGYLKYHAGFGTADILFVVHDAAMNSRVPSIFGWFAAEVLGRSPGVFGAVVPFAEVALGVSMLLGVLPRLASLAAAVMLCTYWLADQLVVQYPLMLMLCSVVLAGGTLARRFAIPARAVGIPWPRRTADRSDAT